MRKRARNPRSCCGNASCKKQYEREAVSQANPEKLKGNHGSARRTRSDTREQVANGLTTRILLSMEQYFGATFRRKEPSDLPSVNAPVDTTPPPPLGTRNQMPNGQRMKHVSAPLPPPPPTPPIPSLNDWTTPRVSATPTPRGHQLRPRREVARPYPGRLRTAMTEVADAGGDASSGSALHMHSERQRRDGPRERKGIFPSDAA